jgi:hypothetical protein
MESRERTLNTDAHTGDANGAGSLMNGTATSRRA